MAVNQSIRKPDVLMPEYASQRSMMLMTVYVLLLIAVFFRLWQLGTIPGVNGDEAWLGWKAFGVAHGQKMNWATNSGNLTNPFYILPLIGLHEIFQPSVWLLRSVSAISGLLLLPLNYLICRRAFGPLTAIISTLLFAVLPVNIVYSRFGWEPSQSVLFAVTVLYVTLILSATRRHLLVCFVLLAGTFVMALIVHPTNSFLFVFAVAGIGARIVKPEVSARRLVGFFGLLLIGCAVFGFIAVLNAPGGVREEIVGRLDGMLWMRDFRAFLLAWLRMFDGINSLSFVLGSWPRATETMFKNPRPYIYWPDSLALIAFTVSLLAILNSHRANSKSSDEGKQAQCDKTARMDRVLLAGFLSTSFLFDILNGPGKIAVWNDRYGLWMVPAGVLILSRGWVGLLRLFPLRGGLINGCGLFFCALLLLETWSGYFLYAQKTGGNSGLDVRIGQQEIHMEAAHQLEIAAKTSGVGHPALISSDWFAYWPIAYSLMTDRDWKKWETVLEELYPRYRNQGNWDLLEAVKEGRVAFADFSGSNAWEVWDRVAEEAKITYRKSSIKDVAGRPVLIVKIPELWFRHTEAPHSSF